MHAPDPQGRGASADIGGVSPTPSAPHCRPGIGRSLTIIGVAICAIAAPSALASPTAIADHQSARAELETVSAELALARTRARALIGAERDRNRRVQERLEDRRAHLVRHESRLAGQAELAIERERRRLAQERARRLAAAQREERDAIAAASPAIGTPPGTSAAAEPQDGALATTIDNYLASKSSPLTGQGATFVAASRTVGLDPRLLVAVAGAETAFGTYGPSQRINNPFGMGPGIHYASWADAIRGAARNLGGSLYLGDGRVTIPAIHQRWAPIGASNDPGGLNGGWSTNVGHYYRELGGDPSGPVFTSALGVPTPTSAPAAPAEVSRSATARTGAPRASARPRPARAAPRTHGPMEARWLAAPTTHGPIVDLSSPLPAA